MFKTGYLTINFYSGLPARARFITVTDMTMFGLTGSTRGKEPSALNTPVTQVTADRLRSTR